MRLFILFFLFFLNGISQSFETNKFEIKLAAFKEQNNLEEHYYSYLDAFLNNAKANNIKLLKQAETSKWREPITNKEKIASLHLKANLGYHYLQFGDVKNSINNYEKAFDYYQKQNIKNYDIINYCLKALANNYTRIGDFERAEELFKYTIDIASKTKQNKELITTYLNYSIVLQTQNKNKNAIKLLEKALGTKGISISQKQQIKAAIAKNYYFLNNYKKSLAILNNLEANFQNNTTKALCFLKLNQFSKAKELLKKSFKLNNKSPRKIAKNYHLLAQINIEENELNKAISNYQKALKILITDFNPKNVNENPPANKLFAENTFLDIFDGKAKVYNLLGQFDKAISSYELAFKVDELLLQSQSSQQAKIIQQKENRTRSGNLVAIYYQLYQKSNDEQFILKALNSVEQSKSKVLFEKLQQDRFKNNLSTDSLLIKEKQFLKEKAILSKKIKLEELDEKINIELVKKLINKKTNLTTKLEVLKQAINQKYPFINSSFKQIDIENIKQLLSENQLVLEFFDTQNTLYIFSISKSNSITWQKIEKDDKYNTALQNYIDLFVRDNGNKLKNKVQLYTENAYYLYNKLLATNLQKNNTNQITIIPDGKLNFIAFDALLTKKSTYTNFEKLPYLVYQNQINYAYSLQILSNQKRDIQQLKNKSILGVFPYFEDNFRGLQELTHTKNEKKIITNFGDYLILDRKKATKDLFLSISNKYDILHLSTHASAGNFEEPAHIEFRNETLYLPEIYGLNLKSNLLILSACETGIGKLQKGEGTMSLARGFLYAGIKNLVVSQWEVNDKSTSTLMQGFYTNYNGENTATALHKAKLDYLQNKNISNLKKTPYYWSGFVFIGNTQPIQTSYYLWIGLLLIGIIIIGFFYLKKNSS